MITSVHKSNGRMSLIEAAFDRLPMAVIIADKQGKVQVANERASALLLMPMESLIGHGLHEILGVWDAQQDRMLTLPLQKILEEGMILPSKEMLIFRANQEDASPLSIAMGPLNDAQGNRTGAVLTLSEVNTATVSLPTSAAPRQRLATDGGAQSLYVRSSGKYVRVLLDELLWVEAMENYVQLQTTKDKFTVHATLKSMVDALEDKGYQRIHRSFLVKKDEIERIEENHVVVQGKLLPIGKSYRAQLLESLTLI